MGEDILYRHYKPGDEEGIVQLLQAAFNSWKDVASPLEYYRWKYLEDPIPPIIVVALDDEKIVGVNHFLCSRMKIGESVHDVAYGTDVATHPDYRGRGIYNRINVITLEEQRKKGIKIGFSFTLNKTIANRGLKKGRLQFPHKYVEMIRVKNIDKYLGTRKSTRIRIGFKAFTALNTISSFKQKHEFTGFEIFKTSKLEQNMQDFLTKVKKGYTLFPERNNEYLTWSYLNPHTGNKVQVAMKNGEVLGYIVTELWKMAIFDHVCISELIALPERLDVAEALLSDTCSYFDSMGINVMYYRVFKGHPYYAIAGKYGFFDTSFFSNFYFAWQYKDAKSEFETIRAASPKRLHLPHSKYF